MNVLHLFKHFIYLPLIHRFVKLDRTWNENVHKFFNFIIIKCFIEVKHHFVQNQLLFTNKIFIDTITNFFNGRENRVFNYLSLLGHLFGGFLVDSLINKLRSFQTRMVQIK